MNLIRPRMQYKKFIRDTYNLCYVDCQWQRNRKVKKYEKSNSSNNDETREYSSEDPGDSPKKAKVFELRIFERIKE